MCSYCDKIYKDDIELSNAKLDSVDEDFYISDGIVEKDGRFDIVIPDQDGNHSVTDIKFCPYCGKQLVDKG